MHWRTWRVGVRLSPDHQRGVAEELVREMDARRPAPLMITNFPDADLLNHAVLVYDYRRRSGMVEFLAYDPNDPGTPLGIHFDPATFGFWVGESPYSPPGIFLRVPALRLSAPGRRRRRLHGAPSPPIRVRRPRRVGRRAVTAPIAITGAGVVTAIGQDLDTFWAGLVTGVSGISEVERFPVAYFG